jgi:hypothetical protein
MALSDYVQTPGLGGYVKKSDGSGPYTVNFGMGSSGATNWVPLPGGSWGRTDGSGPYFRDVTVGTVTALFTVGT